MAEIKIPKRNVDLEQLGLINQGLFTVDGELAKRYNSVLKQVFDWDCDLDSFRVDKRGISPEVADYLMTRNPDHRLLEFAENYLNIGSANRYMIVVSPDQKGAPLVFPQTSYEDGLFDEVYRQARHTIEDVTHTEALFGELENGIDIFRTADDLLQLKTVETSLDTRKGTVRDCLELDKMLGKFDVQNALDDAYVARLQELAKNVGSSAGRAISKVFPITREVHCFYAEFFNGVHCLRNFKNKDGIAGIFISHHQGRPRDLGSEIVSLDLHDDDVIATLHKYKFLQYNPELVCQRLQEIEDDTLLAAGIDVADLDATARKREVTGRTLKYPLAWKELSEVRKILSNTSAKIKDLEDDLCYETRLKLSEPVSKPEVLNHMLAELDPTDTLRMYQFNVSKLRREFPKMPLNRQRHVANVLLNTQLNQTGGKK
ncbi:MAG: DUF6638 family protein [archaeon]